MVHHAATAALADDVRRELVRVADRLRILGPRWAARSVPEDGALVADVRAMLQVLADLAAEPQGRPRLPVPELALHGLADQVLVLGHDLVAVGDAAALAAARDALAQCRRAL